MKPSTKAKTPSTFIVFFEDSAALLGLVIAFIGIFVGQQTHNPYADGVASILIGAILGLVAFFLAYESKGLLIGEGVDREVLRHLRMVIEKDAAVEHVNRLLTMHFGPHEVMLTLEVKFRDNLSMVEVRNTIGRLQESVQQEYPDITRIYFASESIAQEQRHSDSSGAD